MAYDEKLERDIQIDLVAQKYDELLKKCQAKKSQRLCYCEENKARIIMHVLKPNFTQCDICFEKLQDDEDWHHNSNFLAKSWTEEGIDPGP